MGSVTRRIRRNAWRKLTAKAPKVQRWHLWQSVFRRGVAFVGHQTRGAGKGNA